MRPVLLLPLSALVLLSSCAVSPVPAGGPLEGASSKPEVAARDLDPFPDRTRALMLVTGAERSRTVWSKKDYTTGRITLHGRSRPDSQLKVTRIDIDFFRYYSRPNQVRAFYVPDEELVYVNLSDAEYADMAALVDSGKPLGAAVASHADGQILVALAQR